MPDYPERVTEHFLAPRNVGEVAGADVRADRGSFVRGAALRLTLRVDAESGRISEARFLAAGCPVLVVAASLLTQSIEGLSFDEAAALSKDSLAEQVLIDFIGGPPAGKAHCLKLCGETLAAALAGYRQTTREEWSGDEALICTCFGVSERTIESAVRAGALQTVRQVTAACNAGGGCGSCRPLIQDILDDLYRTEELGGNG